MDIPPAETRNLRPINNSDLLALRDLHGVSISPDGKYVAFVVGQAIYATNSYRSGLFVVRTEPGNIPLALGSAGPPHWDDIGAWEDEPPQWAPDSRYVTCRVETNGTWQVFRWSRKGGPPAQLTHIQGGVESYKWASDGSKLVLTVNKLGDQAQRLSLSEHGILYDGGLSASNGIPPVAQLAARNSSRETWIYDLATDQERKATEEETKFARSVGDLDEKLFQPGDSLEGHHIIDATISPDGQTLVYKDFFSEPAISNEGTFALIAKPLHGGTPRKLTAGVAHISQYWWKQDSTQIYYTENSGDGHPSKLMAVARAGGSPKQLFGGPDWLQDWSIDNQGRYAACTRQTSTTPPQVAVLDLGSGTVRILVDVNPEFKNLNLSEAVRIEGTNSYGDRWFGHLVRPIGYQAGKRYPLIITTYVSGDSRFLRGGTGDEYPIQVFAANGFAVLSFDTGTIRSFRTGNFREALLQWTSPVASMQMAVKELVEMGIVDPNRVGVTGLSHGAEMVEYAISHTNFVQAAVESGGGARDPYFYYLAGGVWHKIFSDWGLGGWPEGNSKPNWRVLSPALNADRVRAPLLSNAADSEWTWSLPLVVSLQQLGKPVELFIYPDELHVKNQPKHRYEIYERNVDWFKFWLKAEEDPAPVKVDQYARWRELRKLQQKNEATRTGSKQ